MADPKGPESGDGPKAARPKAQTIDLSATEVTASQGEAKSRSKAGDDSSAAKPAASEKPAAPDKAAASDKAAPPETPISPDKPSAASSSAASKAGAAAASSERPRAAEPPRPPAPSSPARDGLGGLGLLFAVVAGAGLAVVLVSLFQDRLIRVPAPDLSRVMAAEQKIDGLRRDLGALTQRVTELTEASDTRAIGQRLGALDQRLGAIDQRVSGYDGRIGGLGQTVEGANGRVSGLEGEVKVLRDKLAALPPDPAINVLTGRVEGVEYRIQGLPTLEAIEVMATRVESAERRAAQAAARDDVTILGDRIATVNGKIDPIGQRVEALAAALRAFPKGDPAARLVVAIASLDQALSEGRPFVSELQTVKAAAGDSGELRPLDAHAASGLPTREALSSELSSLLAKLEPLKAAPQGTIIERFVANAGGVLTITSKDAAEGTDPAAVRARMAQLAAAGDVEQALALRGKLDETARAASDGWARKAEGRVAAETAVGSARTAALARLSAN